MQGVLQSMIDRFSVTNMDFLNDKKNGETVFFLSVEFGLACQVRNIWGLSITPVYVYFFITLSAKTIRNLHVITSSEIFRTITVR